MFHSLPSTSTIGRVALLIVAVCLLVPAISHAATTWHVALTGSNDHPGTADQPFAHIQHALDQAKPGDVIQVGPGHFNENLVITRSGEPDRPITLQGTLGPGGQWLTVIDAGQAIDPATWRPAFDIGPNVYRNDSFTYQPQLITVDGLYVGHVHPENATRRLGDDESKGDPMHIIAWPEDHVVTTQSSHAGEVPFWETIKGIYVHDPEQDNAIYLRLAGGVDPRQRETAVSPGGAVVTIQDASHIILRDLAIERGELGVQITGRQAQHNLIDHCYISHGRTRVLIRGGASHNIVSNCHIAMAFYGTRPGAWGGTSRQSSQQEYVYNFFKMLANRAASSDDRAITVRNGAKNTTIIDNHLDGGLVAVTSSHNTDLVVARNVIHDFSSVGLSIITGSVNAHFHDNIIYNCNKNIRLHRLNQGDGFDVYIYRNRSYQPDDVGEHIYTHAHTEEQLARMNIQQYDNPRVAIYHNTFVGGTTFWSQTTRLRNGPVGFRLVNNVISAQHPFRWLRASTPVGLFDYNWVGGTHLLSPSERGKGQPSLTDYEHLPWFGPNNVAAIGHSMDIPSDPTASPWTPLPANSPLREAGIDLSQPFTIGDQTYTPLPGMTPDYFPGNRPDIGYMPPVHAARP